MHYDINHVYILGMILWSYCKIICPNTCRLVEIASTRYQDGVRSGMDGVAAWNDSSVDWTIAAKVRHSCPRHLVTHTTCRPTATILY